MDQDRMVRDFGVLPGEPAPGTVRVRSEMTRGNVFGQFLMTAIMLLGCGGTFIALGIGAAVLGIVSWGTKDAVFLVGLPFCLAMAGTFLGVTIMVMRRSNAWVELDGETIRAQNLYTRKVIERSVWEIEEILTEVFLVGSAAVRITEALQGRVRGFAIRFRDLPKGIRVYRPEMTNVAELIQAVAAKMAERGPVAPEIIQFEGRPMVRRITWEERLRR